MRTAPASWRPHEELSHTSQRRRIHLSTQTLRHEPHELDGFFAPNEGFANIDSNSKTPHDGHRPSWDHLGGLEVRAEPNLNLLEFDLQAIETEIPSKATPRTGYLNYEIRDEVAVNTDLYSPRIDFSADRKIAHGCEASTDTKMQGAVDHPVELAQAPLLRAIRTGDSASVVDLLTGPSSSPTLTEGVSRSLLHEAIREARPTSKARWLNDFYQPLSDARTAETGLRPLDDLWRESRDITMKLAAAGERTGRSLSSHEYGWLHQTETGLTELSDDLLSVMGQNGVRPDRSAYHALLKAHGAMVPWPRQRARQRVTTYNQSRKQSDSQTRRLDGHSNGAPDDALDAIRSVSRQMQDDEIDPDEETYRALMHAYARAGKTDSIKQILTQVWDVTLNSQTTQTAKPRPGIVGSALEPTPRLLWTIVHCFGANNDVPTALQLIDTISKQYSLKIDITTWTELMVWTYVLSLRRPYPDLSEEKTVGQLPEETVHQLFDLMRSEYSGEPPSMPILEKLVTRAKQQRDPDKMASYAEQELNILKGSRRAAFSSKRSYNLLRGLQVAHSSPKLAKLIKQEMRIWEEREANRIRDHQHVRKAAGQAALLYQKDKSPSESFATMEFVQQWGPYLERKTIAKLSGARYTAAKLRRNGNVSISSRLGYSKERPERPVVATRKQAKAVTNAPQLSEEEAIADAQEYDLSLVA